MATAWGTEDLSHPVFRDFRLWTERLALTEPGERGKLLEEGLRLARERRLALAAMLRQDPALALALAVPLRVAAALPSEVRALIEERVNAEGRYLVTHLDFMENGRLRDEVRVDMVVEDRRWQACVYGWRSAMPHKESAPVSGIALDGMVAIHQSTLLIAEGTESPEETATVLDAPAVAKLPAGAVASVLARCGNRWVRFASIADLETAEERLRAAQCAPSTALGSPVEDCLMLRAPVARSYVSTRAVGTKRILVFRADLEDMPGDPVDAIDGHAYTAAAVEAYARDHLAPFFRERSYGVFTPEIVVAPKIYRVPYKRSTITINEYGLMLDSLLKQAKADFDASTFDYYVIITNPLPGYPAGLGGGDTCMVYGYYNFRTVEHELGHVLGLDHSRLWQGNPTPFSDTGSTQEYGDVLDLMGGGQTREGSDFNLSYKQALRWLKPGQLETVSGPGTYRLYLSDATLCGQNGSKLLGLRIPRDASSELWVAYRSDSSYGTPRSGAYVLKGNTSAEQFSWAVADALQMNLLSGGNSWDVAGQCLLPVGRAFTDPKSGYSVSLLSAGGTGADAYIDVRVSSGTGDDVAPQIGLNPASQLDVSMGDDISFSIWAEAGGNLSYQWQHRVAGSSDWVDLAESAPYKGTRTGSLLIVGVPASLSDSYFRCVMRNGSGQCTSEEARLTVLVRTEGSETFAGKSGQTGLVDAKGSQSRFNFPSAILQQDDGGFLVSDLWNFRIRQVGLDRSVRSTPDQWIRFLSFARNSAGVVHGLNMSAQLKVISEGVIVDGPYSAAAGYGYADGPIATANLGRPTAICFDAADNLWFIDQRNQVVRKISPAGVVSTVAGKAGSPGYADGQGEAARFNFIDGMWDGMCFDRDNTLLITDSNNHCVRRITPSGMVTTLPGRGVLDTGTPISDPRLISSPFCLTVDANGVVYVGCRFMIRVIEPGGAIGVLLGNDSDFSGKDGVGTAATAMTIGGLCLARDGNLYFTDANQHVMRRYLPTAPRIMAGPVPLELDAGMRAQFSIDVSGSFPWPGFRWQSRAKGNETWVDLSEDGRHSGVAGSRLIVSPVSAAQDGTEYRCIAANTSGSVTSAPARLTVRAAGLLRVAGIDGWSSAYQYNGYLPSLRVNVRGDVTVAAGPAGGVTIWGTTYPNVINADFTGLQLLQFSGAYPGNITSVAPNGNGGYYVGGPGFVLGVASSGAATVLAGTTSQTMGSSDGLGAAASFSHPRGMVRLASGDLLISDHQNHTIRRVTPQGLVSTIAGVAGSVGQVDGALGVNRLNYPASLALDDEGNLFITDSSSVHVRKLSAAGSLSSPWSSSVLPNAIRTLSWHNGVLYLADEASGVIRTIARDGTVGVLKGEDGAPLAVGTVYSMYITPTHGLWMVRGGGYLSFHQLEGPATILTQPGVSGASMLGQPLRLEVAAAGRALRYQWQRNGQPIAGATESVYHVSSAAVADAGVYTVVVSNDSGSVVSQSLTVNIALPPTAEPVISPGGGTHDGSVQVTLSCATAGAVIHYTTDGGTPTAASSMYSAPFTLSASATVKAMAVKDGCADSGVASASFIVVPLWSRLVNISVRSVARSQANPLIMGFVVKGGAKPLLMRAWGPALMGFGVAGTMPDPQLELHEDIALGGKVVGYNDNWGTGNVTTLRTVFASTGAYNFPDPVSRDATLLQTIAMVESASGPRSINTLYASDTGNHTGVTLLELYDTEEHGAGRLVNVSARNYVGTGDEILVIGFSIRGTKSRRLLVRGIAPTLAAEPFNLPGMLADPLMKLFVIVDGKSTQIGGNDNWAEGGEATLRGAFTATQAFNLPDASSKDAAMIVELEPGLYSVELHSKTGQPGDAMIEVYELE